MKGVPAVGRCAECVEVAAGLVEDHARPDVGDELSLDGLTKRLSHPSPARRIPGGGATLSEEVAKAAISRTASPETTSASTSPDRRGRSETPSGARYSCQMPS